MTVYLTARKPTDSVTLGLLPAAARLGLPVVLLTDQPGAHEAAYAGLATAPVAVVGAEVGDAGAVASRVAALGDRYGRPGALLSNSDHLQAATALAAELLDLPAKPWRAAVRAKNKALMRQRLAGLDAVVAVELGPDDPPVFPTFPAVVKPREGVASEDVLLVRDEHELVATVAAVRARRPGAALLVEEYLEGPLLTFDTLGDGTRRCHTGTWRTMLGPPPAFTEVRLDWAPAALAGVRAQLDAQLDALGVGLGACHTEVVLQGERVRIIEVNYRLIGDLMDVVTADVLGVDLFEAVLRVHAGEALPAAVCAARGDRHGRVDYVLAERPGTLVAAPPDEERSTGGLTVGHRRMRAVGVTAPLDGSNRDYLSAVWATGPDVEAVDAAVDGYRETHEWRIT
ncbi:ATP-grasp domain-containing protein [Pseudonocardia sp. CA-107938]|uniref:ATP-grasp domain-containing protein n=1 Tax=Pseudonocardia sp. CA-107938 TaxID=3240021 RepID=UPI003D8C4F53